MEMQVILICYDENKGTGNNDFLNADAILNYQYWHQTLTHKSSTLRVRIPNSPNGKCKLYFAGKKKMQKIELGFWTEHYISHPNKMEKE